MQKRRSSATAETPAAPIRPPTPPTRRNAAGRGPAAQARQRGELFGRLPQSRRCAAATASAAKPLALEASPAAVGNSLREAMRARWRSRQRPGGRARDDPPSRESSVSVSAGEVCPAPRWRWCAACRARPRATRFREQQRVVALAPVLHQRDVGMRGGGGLHARDLYANPGSRRDLRACGRVARQTDAAPPPPAPSASRPGACLAKARHRFLQFGGRRRPTRAAPVRRVEMPPSCSRSACSNS